jgi:hypothetical protein
MYDAIAMLQAEELRKKELEILRKKVKEQQDIIEELKFDVQNFEKIIKHYKNELKSK